MRYVFGCYALWGLFPLFFPLLLPAGAGEILAHRMLWTCVVMVIVMTVAKRWQELRGVTARQWGLIAAASALISLNWGVYVFAVNTGHVTEAALGYFMNPLVSVVLGVVVQRESLRRLQLVAVLIATAAVLWLTLATGTPPYLGLILAVSFGLYGLLKARTPLSGPASLTAESLVAVPCALGFIGYLSATGQQHFIGFGTGHSLLMVLSGVITAVPLLLFAQGAKAVTLATLGMMQYITPSAQLLIALFINHEYVEPSRWVGFVGIWIAVAFYLYDLLATTQRRHRPQQVSPSPRSGPPAPEQ